MGLYSKKLHINSNNTVINYNLYDAKNNSGVPDLCFVDDDKNVYARLCNGDNIYSSKVKLSYNDNNYSLYSNTTFNYQRIKDAVNNDEHRDMFKFGDLIPLKINGTFGDFTYDNVTIYAMVSGFDIVPHGEQGKKCIQFIAPFMEDGTSLVFSGFVRGDKSFGHDTAFTNAISNFASIVDPEFDAVVSTYPVVGIGYKYAYSGNAADITSYTKQLRYWCVSPVDSWEDNNLRTNEIRKKYVIGYVMNQYCSYDSTTIPHLWGRGAWGYGSDVKGWGYIWNDGTASGTGFRNDVKYIKLGFYIAED